MKCFRKLKMNDALYIFTNTFALYLSPAYITDDVYKLKCFDEMLWFNMIDVYITCCINDLLIWIYYTDDHMYLLIDEMKFRSCGCVELVSETCVCWYMCLSINSNVPCQGYECSVWLANTGMLCTCVSRDHVEVSERSERTFS